MLWSRRTGTQAISWLKALKYRTYSPEMVCGQGTKGGLVCPGAVNGSMQLFYMTWSWFCHHPQWWWERESCDPYSWDAFPLGHHRNHALILWFEVMPNCRVGPMPLPSPGGNLRVSTLMTVGGHCTREPLGESFGVNEANALCRGYIKESAQTNVFLTNAVQKYQPVLLKPDCKFVLKVFFNV